MTMQPRTLRLVAAMSLEIRAFRRSTDLAAVAELWRTALAPEWPVLPDGLELLRGGYVAVRDGRCVGMVAVAADDWPRPPGDPAGPSSSLRFLAVAPGERRRGIATRLVEHGLGDLRRMGVSRVGAGSGAGPYIWPGVPLDRPDAVAFFDALGWDEPEVVTDLTADLQAAGLDEQLGRFDVPAGMSLALPPPDQRDRVLAFEDQHFPIWSRWFREPGNDVVAAYDEAGRIAATLLVAGPGQVTVYWPLLGDDSASIACVGVAPPHENRGVGSAMVAHASRVLRERGARVCHIGWTVRTAFYGRIGYQPWRRYSMRGRAL